MSSSTAELTLILKAQNLAESAFTKLKTDLTTTGSLAKTVAGDMVTAFKGLGGRIGRELANLATDILSGGSIENDLKYMGITLAGAAAEGLGTTLVPKIVAKITATGYWKAATAAVTTAGTALGGAISAAIPLAMAALPAVIAALVTAAIIYAITHGMLDARVSDYVPSGTKYGRFGAITGPRRQGGPDDGKAEGGWVGMNGPEMVLTGEKGPEFVRKAGTGTGDGGTGGGSSGFRIVGVSLAEITEAVDRGLYFKLQRAAPVLDRP